MQKIALDITFNVGAAFSAAELIELYFTGINIHKNGHISSDSINFFIDASVKELEGYLNLKILPQVIEDKKDFVLNEWRNWGYVKTSYPVRKIIKLSGQLNGVQQIEYPRQWLTTQQIAGDDVAAKQIHIVPGMTTGQTNSVLVYGLIPQIGMLSYQFIPDYWHAFYETGFSQIPQDILNVIGKLAALNLFVILGDLILGTPGLSSKSISIDGLSQNFSIGNKGYGARIENYINDLKETMPRLKNKYSGFEMMSM